MLMDSDSKRSGVNSLDGSSVELSCADHKMIKHNGVSNGEIDNFGVKGNADGISLPLGSVDKDMKIEPHGNSGALGAQSVGLVTPVVTKGHGLRKWRRIRREAVKDGSVSLGSSRNLGWGLSGSVNQNKPASLSAEVKQTDEGFARSAKATRYEDAANGSGVNGCYLGSEFGVKSTSHAGVDSDDSKGQSGKSSTAADSLTLKLEPPLVSGHVWENYGLNNLNATFTSQYVRQGSAPAESSKKPRGERIKIYEENSQSSVESDSMSSCFASDNDVHSPGSKEREYKTMAENDGENNTEAQESEERSNEDIQTDYSSQNGREFQGSRGSAANNSWEQNLRSEHLHPSEDQDPLQESLLNLQRAEKELERELQKVAEMHEKPVTNSHDQIDSRDVSENAHDYLETQVLALTEKIRHLESNLVPLQENLKIKELRISELEAQKDGNKSWKDSLNTMDLGAQKMVKRMDIELEGLYRQKIEAEVEYLAISRMILQLRSAADSPIRLLKVPAMQSHLKLNVLSNPGEADKNTERLKKQMEKFENLQQDVLVEDEVIKLQIGACRVTSCFVVQLTLLIVVFWMLILQLSPNPKVSVPT